MRNRAILRQHVHITFTSTMQDSYASSWEATKKWHTYGHLHPLEYCLGQEILNKRIQISNLFPKTSHSENKKTRAVFLQVYLALFSNKRKQGKFHTKILQLDKDALMIGECKHLLITITELWQVLVQNRVR